MPSSAWITTFTGGRFYVLEPRPIDVRIEDIAHALSLLCRFTGHIRQFYSVAQHSVLVSRHCHPKDALWGLLHDATEAYVGDMSAPLKHTTEMRPFRNAEDRVMAAIANRFHLDSAEPASVRAADKRMLLTEARDLGFDVTGWYKGYSPFDFQIEPWPPRHAEFEFLSRCRELMQGPPIALCQADGYVAGDAV